MHAPGHDESERAGIGALLSGSGVAISAAEADIVSRSVARIRAAAASLLAAIPFDLPSERFYGLLESDAAREDKA